MSNILPEDVKLMSEFMGYHIVTLHTGRCGNLMGQKHLNKSFNVVPDYPKDMNALLGVMDKMRESGYRAAIHTYPDLGMMQLTVAPDNWEYVGEFDKPSDLPTVLFPLLVEAIKQIKESE